MPKIEERNGFLFLTVPEDAKDFIIDMGYLIFKIMDIRAKWTTDKEIEEDVRRFLRTGKSKFDNMTQNQLTELGNMWVTTGIPLPDRKLSIVGLSRDLTEEQWDPIVESYSRNVGWDFERKISTGIMKLYRNYMVEKPTPVSMLCNTAKESGYSRLRSWGLDGNILIIQILK